MKRLLVFFVAALVAAFFVPAGASADNYCLSPTGCVPWMGTTYCDGQIVATCPVVTPTPTPTPTPPTQKYCHDPARCWGPISMGLTCAPEWTSTTPCGGATPTPTPTPTPTGPCPDIRPRLRKLIWHWLDTSVPTTIFYTCDPSTEAAPCLMRVDQLDFPGGITGLRYGGWDPGLSGGSVSFYNQGHLLVQPDSATLRSIVVIQGDKAIPPDAW